MSGGIDDAVWDALKSVRFPGMSRDVVSFGFVKSVEVAGGRAVVRLVMSTQKPEAAAQVRADVERAVGAVAGVSAVEVALEVTPPPAVPSREESAARAVAKNPNLIPRVRSVVAVASGKGGVGKSTVAANLAVALARAGKRTGLLDVDIHGPSVPTMFGIDERPVVVGNRIRPFEKYGIRLMSLGFVLEQDTPVIWRGPMVMRAIEQMLGDVDWGELDFLILDMPPGTGDAQLTVLQKIDVAGAVIVTTPQDVALIDARKGLAMFRKLEAPVLGIVENMSVFVCPACGHESHVFRSGGGERTARELDVPFLGGVPLDPAIAEGGDAGVPIVVARPEGPHAEAFAKIARSVVDSLA
jgi:ATP-binding protein involved in chromosome partitioning